MLSMSGRIMNEVFHITERWDIPVFYQDTDSIHIDNSRFADLADEFRKVPGRELIGSELGPFHSDITTTDRRSDVQQSTRSS